RTANTEQVRIDKSGNVGIGTTNPLQKLQVAGRIRIDTWTADGDTVVYKSASGDIGLTSSDLRLKKNLEPLTGALAKITSLSGYLYNPVEDSDGSKKRLGLIAQDLIAVGLPEATYTFTNEAGEEFYGIHYEKLTALLVEGIKEQNLKINELGDAVKNLTDAQQPLDISETSEILASQSRDIATTVDALTNRILAMESYLGIGATNPESVSPPETPSDLSLFTVETDFVSLDQNLVLYKDLSVLGKTTLGDLSLTGDLSIGLLTINGLAEEGVSINTLSGDLVLQNSVKISKTGNLEIAEGVIAGNESFRDVVNVSAEITEVVISKTWDTPPTTITVTPSYETTVWVEGITKDGFTIKLGTAPTAEQKLYWIAVW
ncbi:tail fiber domain-containing protein, partial [Candidatus Parcubacteria bacterium]|nr:tail fiber domain-containing protein [Patescibacteria group bacterium]MCG2689039.1 tail fiber domain-containing protein [Candidatus Parcubacteria bacterium]